MKKLIKKIALALPTVLILTLILSLTASAATAIVWQELDDKTISDGVNEYTLFESPYAISEGSVVQFVYENSPYGNYVSIYSYEKHGDIAWTDYGYIYVTDTGRDMLLSLEAGEAGSYRIYTDYYSYSEVDGELYDSLIALNENALTIDVRELYDYYRIVLYGVDPTGSFIMPYGAAYYVDDCFYYLSYLDLPNNCFTADGEFSYMKGEVDVYPIGDALAEELITLVDNATPKYPEYVYEVEYTYEIDEQAAITAFYVIFALVMLLCPAVFLAISIANAVARKRRSSRLWLVGVLLALLWIAVAVTILVIIS